MAHHWNFKLSSRLPSYFELPMLLAKDLSSPRKLDHTGRQQDWCLLPERQEIFLLSGNTVGKGKEGREILSIY
jgi:hypothetical protein